VPHFHSNTQSFNIANHLNAKAISPGLRLISLCETINFEHKKSDSFPAPSLGSNILKCQLELKQTNKKPNKNNAKQLRILFCVCRYRFRIRFLARNVWVLLLLFYLTTEDIQLQGSYMEGVGPK